MDRSWLDVPSVDKEEAKDCGARWDPVSRRWYAPDGVTTLLKRWEPLPDPLPGEDRTFGSGLFVDLVPDSCWLTNIRSCLGTDDWRRLRRLVVGRADRRCEACGRGKDVEAGRRLEVHERWAFDDRSGVQTLQRLICLCSDCHATSHYGIAQVRGNELRAFTHLREVTGMSLRRAERHVDDAFAVWHKRNRRVWTLDLSILTDVGVTPVPPAGSAPRAAAPSPRRVGQERAAPASTAVLDRPQHEDEADDGGRRTALRRRARGLARTAARRLGTRYPALARTVAVVRLWTAPSTWRPGVDDDSVTGRALARLARPWYVRLGHQEQSWHVLTAVPLGADGGELAHLVIGPGGVYAVETRRHPGGTVWAGDHYITVDGQATTYVQEAQATADRVGALLSAAAGRHVQVIPVVAVEGGRVTGVGQARGVRVVAAHRLARHLRSDLRPFDEDRVRQLCDLAHRPTTWRGEG